MHPWIVPRVGIHGRAAVLDGFGPQFVVPGLVSVDPAEPVHGAVFGQPRRGAGGPDVNRVPRHMRRRVGSGHPSGGCLLLSRTSRPRHEVVASDTPESASRCSPRSRSRPLPRPLQRRGGTEQTGSRLATAGFVIETHPRTPLLASAVGSDEVAVLTTTRAARMVDRRRRAAVPAGSLSAMPLFKTAWRCAHVCGFRYTDDMSRLVASRVYACVDRRGRALTGRSHP